MMLIIPALFVAFFYCLKKYQRSLEDYEAKGGVLEPKCPWKKNNKKCESNKQSNVISFSINNDRQFPQVVAP